MSTADTTGSKCLEKYILHHCCCCCCFLTSYSHVADTDCPILGKPISGRKYGSEYNHGDIVTFECDQGFVLKGSAVRRCMENGTWNGTEAICIGKLYGATCLIAFFLNLNNSFPNHSCLESPDQFDYTRLETQTFVTTCFRL